MSEHKHTPGPWQVARYRAWHIIHPGGSPQIIAKVSAKTGDNVDLLASASLGLKLAEMVLEYGREDSTEPLWERIQAKAREVLKTAVRITTPHQRLQLVIPQAPVRRAGDHAVHRFHGQFLEHIQNVALVNG